MLVKIVKAPMVPGGKAVVLCDDKGKPLDGQVHSVLDCELGETPTITVKFEIDGKNIRLGD